MKKVYNVCLAEMFDDTTFKAITCPTIEDARKTMGNLIAENMYPTKSEGGIGVDMDDDSFFMEDTSCGFAVTIEIKECEVEDGKEVMLMAYNDNVSEFAVVTANLMDKKIPSELRDAVIEKVLEVGCITDDEIEEYGEDEFLDAADNAIMNAEYGEVGEFMDDTFVFFNELMK